MTTTKKKQHWLVRMDYRMRTFSFAMLFVATSLHLWNRHYSATDWLLLGALFLAYPHLQYWRALRAPKVVQAEMDNLLIDALFLGIFMASLGFPLWISFAAALGTLSNNATNKGWRGVTHTILVLLTGILISVGVNGFRWSPQTDWPTTLFCMFGLTIYLLAMGDIGFKRNLQLRLTREKLQRRETELLTANDTLKLNLREIDGLQEQLREQANRDPLTGLYNRRYLDSTLERELARCKRSGQPLSLILIDVDHFKRLNDTYGHQAGDKVLIRLGTILGRMARAGDVACRYGGEEFLMLMPTMPLETALERAEELRAIFGAMVVPFGDFRLQTTLSIGISVYPGHGISGDELIRVADHALYQAKNAGRNRVVLEPLR
jgi:diguanylate cyclase (GGDEF)-like protein